ncbi:MAG: Hsp20/alpha crystallin family protein [Gammaproteobacteria bacterium]|nr:Hsp20/alpha crystallin family protein [Gammaproteobacteria bacterium]MDH5801396.1 Hsp20/alpha crystallin family protein [Gammaproteobacteria bacterium]
MKELRKSPSKGLSWGWFDEPFENLFEGFFRPMQQTFGDGLKHCPAIDVKERDKEYLIKADLPGVMKEDIHVNLQDDMLTISAETKGEIEEKEGEVVLRHERHYGKFSRSMRLGEAIDKDKVKANFKDGVLELTLPKLEVKKAKKTEITIN